MDDLIVETTHGKVRGERRGDALVWKGIPYAAPPIGALRFRPPQPAAPWPGVRDATRFGPAAAQSRDPRLGMLSGLGDKIDAGEDCLVLNVFAPAPADESAAARPWPVMVWIHGGAFVFGSGSVPLYHGQPFTADGIVVVTLNYRLGVPGFLYLGDLAPGREAGNYALLDQIAALRWVRDNIAAFGGDPGQVTAMGESAGAMSIGALLAMPSARGLFHRAILQSGAAALSPPSRADATRRARDVLAELAVDVDGLAGVPIERVIAVQEQVSRSHGLGAFAPYVDGSTLPRPAIEVIAEGGAPAIPLLLGSNRDEWTLFEVMFGEVTVEAFQPILRDRFGPLLDRMLEVYRDDHPGRSMSRAWVDLIGDLVFRIPAIRLAEDQARHGAAVYLYRFEWKSPAFAGRLGATHGLELPFVWNRLDLPIAPILLGDRLLALQPLASAIHGSWAQFIRTGDPNGGGLPAWPRYDADRRATLRIDRESQVADDPGGAARALWPAFLPR